MASLNYDLGSNKWFIGQIPPAKNQHTDGVVWSDHHGDRVKVRIPGMHPMSSNNDSKEVSDDELPWAIVAKPTTHGNRNFQSTGIWGGEWVIGVFLDENCQIPVITHVFGNNITGGGIRESVDGTTLGQQVKRSHNGNYAIDTQIKSPPIPKGEPPIDKSYFEDAKQQEDTAENQSEEPLEENTAADAEGDSLFTEEEGNNLLGNQQSQTTAEIAAEAEARRQRQTVERALQRASSDSIAVLPGGLPVNRTPTSGELQEFDSQGYEYVPNSDSDGGRIVKKVGQNYG